MTILLEAYKNMKEGLCYINTEKKDVSEHNKCILNGYCLIILNKYYEYEKNHIMCSHDYIMWIMILLTSIGEIIVENNCIKVKRNKRILIKLLIQSDLFNYKNSNSKITLLDNLNYPTRLLNVQDYKIINSIPGKSLPYAIVSYAWSNISPTKFLNKNEIIGKNINNFLINNGIKYLWVDEKCVFQDDLLDKQKEIPKMRDYYIGSTVCIILLNDIDLELDLEKSIKNNEFYIENNYLIPKIKNDNNICTHKYFQKILNHISKSVWMHRIWTIQEVILPINCIIFVGKYRIPLDDLFWATKSCINKYNKLQLIIDIKAKNNPDLDIREIDKLIKNREATVEEDRIYGLLGIIKPNIINNFSIKYNLGYKKVIDIFYSTLIRNGYINVIVNFGFLYNESCFPIYGDQTIIECYCNNSEKVKYNITEKGLEIPIISYGIGNGKICYFDKIFSKLELINIEDVIKINVTIKKTFGQNFNFDNLLEPYKNGINNNNYMKNAVWYKVNINDEKALICTRKSINNIKTNLQVYIHPYIYINDFYLCWILGKNNNIYNIKGIGFVKKNSIQTNSIYSLNVNNIKYITIKI